MAGDSLIDCVTARLSPVASMAPVDVCHGLRCSLAGLAAAAWGYRPWCWPGRSAGSPQCIQPMGCWFFPVPRPPYVCTCVRRPGPLGSCSPVCLLGVWCCVCGVIGHLFPVHRCGRVVCCVVSAVSWATWLLFTGVPTRCVALLVRCPGPLGSCSPMCPLGVLCCVCGVLGHIAPVHRCAHSVCCVVCAVSWATWPLFTGVRAWFVVLRLRCPGPPSSCSLVCPLGVFCCLCGVFGHLAPVHRCARSVCCVACAVSWATCLLFTGVPTRCVVLCVRCPGSLGSCSPVCLLVVLHCLCGVLGNLAPVHRCAHSVCCVACAVSWATSLLFTGVPTRCVVSCVRCPGPLGPCSPVCARGLLCCVCGVPGHLAPVHWCASSVCCAACAVSSATWLLFTGVPASCFVLRVRCPAPLGSCSPVCPLGVLCCVCVFLGHLAPVHRCARVVCCVASAVSWATWLLFTGVPARCVLLLVRCPRPLGSCSPVCLLGVLCCVCGVLGHLAPVQPCSRSVCCVVCAVSGATWLLFTGVHAWFVVLHLPLGVFCCLCGVLGHLVPVHQCACSVCCVACAVSWATWLLFTRVPTPCVVLLVRCPGPLGSLSPVCPLGALRCACGVLGHLAPVHRCARFVCCVACAVSWAAWLLFTRVPAQCVVLRVRCPGTLGSWSPVCLLSVLRSACGVLGILPPVHQCACSVCCAVGCVCGASLRGAHSSIRMAAFRSRQGLRSLLGAHSSIRTAAVRSWQGQGTRAHTRPSQRRLFRSRQEPAWCVTLRVQCPGLLGSCSPVWPPGCVVSCVRCPRRLASCSPVCTRGLLCCVGGVLGHLALVHPCARSVRCFACAVSWATWLLFTGVPARCVVLLVRCPAPVGSCLPECPLSALFRLCGVVGRLAPVQQCACSVCFAAFSVL